jgi:hypothetical protein
VNRQPLANEKLIYNEGINGTFQRKFRKQGRREFSINTSRFNHSQLKKLLETLFLGLLKKAKLGDFWYIECRVKNENEHRYQILSRGTRINLYSILTPT